MATVVDPDGDLVLLLNPTTPSADAAIIDATHDDKSDSTDVAMALSLEPELPGDEAALVYKDRVVVSSKHMSLASPVFKAMLQGGFQEAVALKTMGRLEVPLPDDDPDAMKTLINIIHGRINAVPFKIELELFTQIAILVDKYQCLEVVRPFPLIWKNELSKNWRNAPWTDVARWICTAWQFDLDEEFLKATQMIRERSAESLETIIDSMEYSLPIPKLVADELESCRLEGIKKAVDILQDTITKYQDPTLTCVSVNSTANQNHDNDYYRSSRNYPDFGDIPSHRKDCDSMVLGSLTKSAILNGLFPLPNSPYTSWSLKLFVDKVKKLEANSLCFKLTKKAGDKHGVVDQLINSVDAIDKSGLTLASCKKLIKKASE